MPAEVVSQSGPGAAKPNGATNTATVAPVTPPPGGATAVVAPPAPQLDPTEELRRERIAAERVRKKFAEERGNWQTEKKTLGEKLSKLAELEKREANARRNPVEYLASVYGDKWYDIIVESKLNGVPPANLIAGEIDKVREEYKSELAKRDEAAKAQAAAAQKAAIEAERTAVRMDARDWYTANEKEYPIFKKFGDANAIAQTLAQRIEAEYHRTTKRDEAGNITSNGRILSAKEAADLVEADLLAIAEDMAAHSKYADKLKAKLTPPAQPVTVVKPQAVPQAAATQPAVPRRTLSNELTGSTPSRPAMTREERRQKAIAAQNAVLKRQT